MVLGGHVKSSHLALGISLHANLFLAGSLLSHLFAQHCHVLVEHALAAEHRETERVVTKFS